MTRTSLSLATTLLLCALAPQAEGQPSVVQPGPDFTLLLNGRPFYPLGWMMPGHCPPSEELYAAARDSLVAEMERMRAAGVNAVFETVAADGRVIPRRVDPLWHNWYNYTYAAHDGTPMRRGHTRPGAFVAGLRDFLDLAYYGPDGQAGGQDRPIYTLVSVTKFIVPDGTASPYGGADTLRCEAFQAFIQEERARHAAAGSGAAFPPVDCSDAPAALPFWEWNLRYAVHGLRDHPGLLGWYLWDEPEDVTWRHLFGILPEGSTPRPYTGLASLPTPDLLRYAYRRTIEFEQEGRPGHARHPIFLDINTPEAFLSNRFVWSREGALSTRWSNGPFDRAPDGRYHIPADVLGAELSSYGRQTAARGGQPAHDWYWDPNLISQRSEILHEAVVRDGLWGGIVIAGQGRLTSGGAYGLAEPLRCPVNDLPRMSLLNDRDLVWHFLTPQINGLRGYLYYARPLTPVTGPGAEQVRRSDRLIGQFQAVGFDRILRTPPVTAGWRPTSVAVHALTNYFRSDPSFVGPAFDYDPGLSALSRSFYLPDPALYRAGDFYRSGAEATYGHPERHSVRTTYGAHRMLRAALHREGEASYLFVSHAYDARITASFEFSLKAGMGTEVEEGRFDLDPGGAFVWLPSLGRASSQSARGTVTLQIDLEPYEVRVFRLLR